MNKRIGLFVLVLLSSGLALAAGYSHVADAQGESLPPGPARGARPLDEVEVLTMPPLDVEALLAASEQRLAAGLPLRFAHPFAVQVTPAATGTWEAIDGDRLLWRLRIASPGAVSLNLGFTRYLMPPGGQLFLYTPDYDSVAGPFTEQDNEVHGELWTPILLGDEIVVELSLPASGRSALELELTSINHGFIQFDGPRQITSGACNVDVVCPQGDDWRDEIRSVGAYSIGGIDTCSGALVNNTAQDLTPYFLTADHCGINAGNAPSVVVYWNYQNSTCRPPGSPESGGPGDGQRNQFNSGAIFRATYGTSDFTLIEMDDPIDPSFNLHWAGWDRSDTAPPSAVAIHHPGVEEKRISFENDPTAIAAYLGDPGSGTTHIRVADWDLGTTEGGSSGSPLFNHNHHIVGDLTGGYAACGNDEPDWYGRLFLSWTGGGTSASRLSDWLDPLNTGVTSLDGRDYIEAPFNLHVTPRALDVCAPADATYGITVTQETAGYTETVTLSVSSAPTDSVAIFSTNPVIPTGTSILTITNTGAAPAGSYEVDVVATAATNALTVTVGLDLYDGTPGLTTLITPADGAMDQPLAPTLEWDDLASASSYNLELDLSPLFGSPLVDASDLLEASYAITLPLAEGRCHWWRVQGNNACGPSDWTSPFHFATAALTTVFADDMESGAGNWSHQADQGADSWTLSTAQSHSGSYAWHVPDAASITDSYLWNTTPVSVGSGSTLTFWHRHQFESSYDGAVLEISTNGGGSWSDLGAYVTANGYNGTLSTDYGNPLGGRQAWVSDLTTWTQVQVDLSSFAGQSVQVRWRIGCDSSVSDVGWYIDDVQVNAPLPPNPAPTLSGITPTHGSTYVDTPVQISGSGFITTPHARLGDTWLLSATQLSSTTLDAVVPAGLPTGVYTLTLYNGDCQVASLPDAFTVTTECVSPTVALAVDSLVELGQAAHFTATVGGSPPFTYTWDFGDGSPEQQGTTSLGVIEASHVYTAVNTYSATLDVENPCGSDLVSDTVEVVCYEPQADISSTSPVTLGQPITFTATVTGTGPFTYSWDFGGPGYGVGLDTATPVYTYTAHGDYDVELLVQGVCGSDTVTETVTVKPVFQTYLPLLLKQAY